MRRGSGEGPIARIPCPIQQVLMIYALRLGSSALTQVIDCFAAMSMDRLSPRPHGGNGEAGDRGRLSLAFVMTT